MANAESIPARKGKVHACIRHPYGSAKKSATKDRDHSSTEPRDTYSGRCKLVGLSRLTKFRKVATDTLRTLGRNPSRSTVPSQPRSSTASGYKVTMFINQLKRRTYRAEPAPSTIHMSSRLHVPRVVIFGFISWLHHRGEWVLGLTWDIFIT
ncbi:hypothetical protein EI94DRAFT_568191 [Lactarius quietus]|nr:hypothetical protein EI94DRAFT_568191 [Lactarius quietus]